MKLNFNRLAKSSIVLLSFCFVVNVAAQELCEWQTGDVPNYEQCVDNLRLDYDLMLENKTSNSTKHKMSRNKIYETLLGQYQILIEHYDKMSFLNEEKVHDFNEKMKSLNKTKDTLQKTKDIPSKTKDTVKTREIKL